jgi:cytoskeletal protein CcmA (bactofilin family)
MAEQACIIGKEITVRGKLSGDEPVSVHGRVEGEIALGNRLVVEESAVVEAVVEAEDLTVYGSMAGDISSTNGVTLRADSKVVGNISAPRVVIEDGARFKGHIEMDVKLPASIGGSPDKNEA